MHSLEQGRERGRGEDHIYVDPVSAAAESLELTPEDINGPNEQHRARRFYELLEPLEIDMLFQQALQLIPGPRRSIRTVRTDGRRTANVAEEPVCLKEIIIQEPIPKRVGRIIPPERTQQLDGFAGVVHQ